ncbi:MAG: hypothetical protein FJ098_12115 [Deltaproteobacteria bacterium]|nr:hypothetical protein [Deltaproteobacteria bacterium]
MIGRRRFLGLLAAGAACVALGRRALAAAGRAAAAAFPRRPWRTVTREELRAPHDRAG